MLLSCHDSACIFFSRCRFCASVRKSVDAVVDTFLLKSAAADEEDDAVIDEEVDESVDFGFIAFVEDFDDDPLNFNLPPTTTLLFAAPGFELLLLLLLIPRYELLATTDFAKMLSKSSLAQTT